jgi:hypothetical protein
MKSKRMLEFELLAKKKDLSQLIQGLADLQAIHITRATVDDGALGEPMGGAEELSEALSVKKT